MFDSARIEDTGVFLISLFFPLSPPLAHGSHYPPLSFSDAAQNI